jgi:hypothetical protein
MLCLNDRFRSRPRVGPNLLGRKGMPTGATSPVGAWCRQVPCSRSVQTDSTGAKRHHQFTTAFEALPLGYSHVVTPSTPHDKPPGRMPGGRIVCVNNLLGEFRAVARNLFP